MYLTSTFHSLLAMALTLAISGQAAPSQSLTSRATSDLPITAQLKLANTATERYALLPNDTDFIYDFSATSSNNETALPIASSQNWPALVGVGLSFSISQLPACTMSFLHLHPRATELFALTSGRIQSYMVPETGVLDAAGNQRVVSTELTPGTVTIYPAGSFHTQVNPDCEAANFTAAFNSEEFAVGLVSARLFALPDEVVGRALGGVGAEEVRRIRGLVPDEAALVVGECVKKCGLEQ
ncbi:germin family protein [Aspergillus brunneoviolaceus CBS 621.78]|uniref:Spherulin-1B n=1 Tax=Aspergillus brunneoviolaceus CBS 621.78 TaxID=1450534 RepID=A0ACD1G1W1_9EURO|nr:putative spherulin-1B precursor [Aspergillus brunneoviolaceus CBS 621.78]RAH43193.1 putative spherulin-1B precursor [Aspergillus brunneoviolaceus CBS 621.78]